MKVILHIGTGKTGTSSIQSTCSANHDILEQHGIYYPQLGRLEKHCLLSVPFYKKRLPREFWGRFGRDKPAADAAAMKLWEQVRQEVSEKSPEIVLLSGERFLGIEDVEGLSAQLAHVFPGADIDLRCYVRHPAAHYLSGLQQVLKASSEIRTIEPRNWSMQIARWSHLAPVIIREFNRDTLVGGDVISDFCATALEGRVDADTLTIVQRNSSMSAEAMVLLQQFRAVNFPNNNNQFNQSTRRFRNLVTLAEKSLPEGVVVSKPSLRDDVYQRVVAITRADTLRLRDEFGFSFADSDLYKAISETEEPTNFQPETLQDVILVNPQVLQTLSARTFGIAMTRLQQKQSKLLKQRTDADDRTVGRS